MNPAWRSRYEVMTAAAQAAGQAALVHYERQVDVEWKTDNSPVTVADRQAEQILRAMISASFPGDGFLGEEFGDTPGTTGYRWIIDPIDGTRCFVRRISHWATIVGLEYRDEIVAGVSFAPADRQFFRAMRGDGTFKNDRRIHVSNVATLDQALACYSGIQFFRHAGREPAFHRITSGVGSARGYGDYYGFVLVAQGSVDLMVDLGVREWDVAGLRVIVEEAGGQFTDWNGNRSIGHSDCLASNGKLHDAALALLRD